MTEQSAPSAALKETQKTEPAQEPTTPGWYGYSGGGQTMIFHLRQTGGWSGGGRQWTVHTDFGSAHPCHWSYIEQALGAWGPLVLLAAQP